MVNYTSPVMTWDVRTRVRQRIARLLEDRGMTNRAFAAKIDHREQWVSNLLAGRFSLKLDELDVIGGALGVPASELVRVSDDPWELSPTEMRVMRALRMLPPAVRDHYVTLADYLVGVTVDEIELVRQIRTLDVPDREVIARWLQVRLRLPEILPTPALPADTQPAVAPLRWQSRRTRVGRGTRGKKGKPKTPTPTE